MATPRWAYLLTYGGLVVFGIIAVIVGVPSIDLTTPDGYRPIWAGFIMVSGIVSAVGLMGHWHTLERWGVLFLVAFTSAYVFAIAKLALQGDAGRQALAVILIVVLIFPASRYLVLVARGRRRVLRHDPGVTRADRT